MAFHPAYTRALGALALVLATLAASAAHAQSTCNDISSGLIYDSDGEVITVGPDDWGYNYAEHEFSGTYCDATRGAPCPTEYEAVGLYMEWNDAWLSNRDCDGDGLLDRHFGFASYRGTDASITNEMTDYYFTEAGNFCGWLYKFRAEAAPLDASVVDGVYYSAAGDELGPVIWVEFFVSEDDYSEFCFW